MAGRASGVLDAVVGAVADFTLVATLTDGEAAGAVPDVPCAANLEALGFAATEGLAWAPKGLGRLQDSTCVGVMENLEDHLALRFLAWEAALVLPDAGVRVAVPEGPHCLLGSQGEVRRGRRSPRGESFRPAWAESAGDQGRRQTLDEMNVCSDGETGIGPDAGEKAARVETEAATEGVGVVKLANEPVDSADDEANRAPSPTPNSSNESRKRR
ncbi:hypothetical protein ACROYT_G017315 [Oculina patagonica]